MSRAPVPDPSIDMLSITRLSTSHVAPHERHDMWQSLGWPSVGPLYECTADPGFTAHTKAVALGDLTLSVGYYGAQVVERTPKLIRRAPVDHCIISFPLDAPVRTDNGLVVPGAAVMLDMAARWRHRSERGKMATVSLPRVVAQGLGIDLAALHGAILAPPAATMLRSHVLQIVDHAETLPAQTASDLSVTVLDLLKVSLALRGSIAAPSARVIDTELRLRANKLIAEALEQPNLNPDYLIRKLGISRSRLYRLFESDGGIQRLIRRERLSAARHLMERGAMVPDIADVAARFHFVDRTHFSRAFRAEFGISPVDWREETSIP